MPMENIPSVLQKGILCNEEAAKVPHRSVALADAQEKRDAKRVPGGLLLHQYANLYFHARNPMMYKRQDEAATLCVVRVSADVAQLDGVVLADRNAAGGDRWVRFLHPRQAHLLDFERIYATSWTDEDRFEYYDKKRKKCAEALVPWRVEPRFLTGAYVVDPAAKSRLSNLGFPLPIVIDGNMFFR